MSDGSTHNLAWPPWAPLKERCSGDLAPKLCRYAAALPAPFDPDPPMWWPIDALRTPDAWRKVQVPVHGRFGLHGFLKGVRITDWVWRVLTECLPSARLIAHRDNRSRRFIVYITHPELSRRRYEATRVRSGKVVTLLDAVLAVCCLAEDHGRGKFTGKDRSVFTPFNIECEREPQAPCGAEAKRARLGFQTIRTLLEEKFSG